MGHRRLKELFFLSSVSLFAKLHHGGPSSLKVVKKILDAGEISSDIISMTDEMYHQQQINGTPKGVYLPISKIHSILAIANLLAHSNLWYIIMYK